MWEALIRRIYELLLQKGIVSLDMVVCQYTDEVIFLTNEHDMQQTVVQIRNFLESQPIKFIKVEPFKLIQIFPPKKGYVKQIFTNVENLSETVVQFKHVAPEHFALFYKKYYNLVTNDMDRHWYQTTHGIQKIDEDEFWTTE